MEEKEILANIKYNTNTAYDSQLTFVGPDKYKISAVKSNEATTRKKLEIIIIESVKERYGN